MEKEVRHFPVELRVDGDDDAPVLQGHAAVFNKLSEDFGGWKEKIQPGAFAEALKADVRALWNHENDLVLGRTKNGTLTLEEDEKGLAFRVTPPDTTWFKDRLVSLKRGDVTGASFGFITEKDEWNEEGKIKIRTIIKIAKLFEISPGVTFPAYPQTKVAMRSMEQWLKDEEERRKKEAGQTQENLLRLEVKKRRLHLQEEELDQQAS